VARSSVVHQSISLSPWGLATSVIERILLHDESLIEITPCSLLITTGYRAHSQQGCVLSIKREVVAN
jgi:hypothetical protein